MKQSLAADNFLREVTVVSLQTNSIKFSRLVGDPLTWKHPKKKDWVVMADKYF
jgi:hypothetical protein